MGLKVTPSQIQNTKQPQSDCLCTVNYLNFTHPPKTACQNPCRNGFFTGREGEPGGEGGGGGVGERGRETPGKTGRESEGEAAERRRLAGEH